MRPGARVADVLGRAAHRRALAVERPARRESRQLALPLGVPVPSRSHPGDFYVVENDRCTCAGFVFGGMCRHVAEAQVAEVFGPMEGCNP